MARTIYLGLSVLFYGLGAIVIGAVCFGAIGTLFQASLTGFVVFVMFLGVLGLPLTLLFLMLGRAFQLSSKTEAELKQPDGTVSQN